jgi:hypothetical protein
MLSMVLATLRQQLHAGAKDYVQVAAIFWHEQWPRDPRCLMLVRRIFDVDMRGTRRQRSL